MSNKKPTNSLSRPTAIFSIAILIMTGIAASFDQLHWFMDYLIWGWVLSFGLLLVWTLFSLRYGVTTAMGNMGRLHEVYRSKEPILFYFLIGFYSILSGAGFVSLLFVLLSGS